MVKYEHKIGSTVGTGVEKEVQNNFNGETQEVGMYLAMSRQASRSGYGELAEVFKRLAWEEAEHAARFCEMNGIIKDDLKANIEMMLEGEKLQLKTSKMQLISSKKVPKMKDAITES